MTEFTFELYEEYCRRQQMIAARLIEVGVDAIHDAVAEELVED